MSAILRVRPSPALVVACLAVVLCPEREFGLGDERRP
jgi:hypothetical protein